MNNPVVRCFQLGREELNVLDHPDGSGVVDDVADSKRLEDHDEHPGGQVGERTL
jgi:hypothetical protein